MSTAKERRARKRRGCTAKKRYHDRVTAMAMALHHSQRPYECRHCGGWHLTSQGAPLL